MRIVCFGDSLTSCGGGWGRYSDILQDRFPDHEFINRGVGGETFEDARERLVVDVLKLLPDVVLIEFGANDWWRDERAYQLWAEDLEHCITQIQDKDAKVIVLGVFGPYFNETGQLVEKEYGADDRSGAYRQLEREVADKHNCPYIDNIQRHSINRRLHWRDRNHPNEYGNRFVADTIEPVLEDVLGCKAVPVRKPGLSTTRDFWLQAVSEAPDKMAVVADSVHLTYAQADQRVQRLAAGLAEHGIGLGSKVAVFMPNCLEYFLLYWAVVRLGAIIVPLNTWLRQENIEAIFNNVHPDMLVVNGDKDLAAMVAAEVCRLKPVFARTGDRFPQLSSLERETEPPLSELPAEAPSIIMHTSGTTSAPKGAVMRHCDLLFNAMTTITAHQFCPDDVHLICNPMFHCTALYSSLPTSAYTRACCVITAATSADQLMQLVHDEKITTFLSIPSIFQRVCALPDITIYNAESLRLIAYAGSVMPVSTIRRLQLYFPEVDLRNFFGLTETISMTHVLKGEEAEERPDSIGRQLPFVDSLIVDKDNRCLGPNEVGELLFARENVIPGYYNEPQRLQESICEIEGREWFRTGDLACFDDEGYFFIKGRKKDMIIVGGENVFAAEVEAILMAHDQVREAVIRGIPATGVRESLGEMIRAYVVPRDRGLTERDVRRFCHERLASFKIPHEIVFMEELPRNPSGKIIKEQLP